MKGIAIKPRAVTTPAPVIDLMAALKRSLAQEAPFARGATATKRSKPAPDRRQAALLLPVSGGRKKNEEAATEPAVVATKRARRLDRAAIHSPSGMDEPCSGNGKSGIGNGPYQRASPLDRGRWF